MLVILLKIILVIILIGIELGSVDFLLGRLKAANISHSTLMVIFIFLVAIPVCIFICSGNITKRVLMYINKEF